MEYVYSAYLIMAGVGIFLNEVSGENFPYSKFEAVAKNRPSYWKLPSRVGMFIIYFPAFCATIYYGKFMSTFGTDVSNREWILTSALTLHFAKRLAEVLFLHKYSGEVDISIASTIGVFYAVSSVSRLYYQQLIPESFYEPYKNVLSLGMLMYGVGQAGNFYHHYLQSTWKRGKDKKYVIPHGGLFEYVACPHYFFEIISFWGLTLISQDIIGIFGTFAVMGNVGGRSVATSKYYRKKLPNYPEDRRNIIPFLF